MLAVFDEGLGLDVSGDGPSFGDGLGLVVCGEDPWVRRVW